jgi:hypothetical protein
MFSAKDIEEEEEEEEEEETKDDMQKVIEKCNVTKNYG